jgi:hypothetical protein
MSISQSTEFYAFGTFGNNIMISHRRSLILAIAFTSSLNMLCFAAPDDAQYAKLIIGKWAWGRYGIVQYMADGTYLIDDKDDKSYGKWAIKNGHLIETCRDKGESTESSTTYDIQILDRKQLVICDKAQRGAILTHLRLHSHDKEADLQR